MTDVRIIGGIAGIAMGLTMLTGASSADTFPLPPGPQPPRPLPELTAEWWQWVYSIPQPYDASGAFLPPYNPLSDSSGANCVAGQRGSVWFLAGTNGATGPATRSCSVPEGASIFFPVISFVNFNTPGCPPGTPNMTVRQLRAPLQPAIDSVKAIFVTVDGADVTKTLVKLVQTLPFELAFPAQNIFGPQICNGTPLLPGIYSPAVSEGYYVWLPPLTPRTTHTISFSASGGTSFFGPNVQNVTYKIVVEPVS